MKGHKRGGVAGISKPGAKRGREYKSLQTRKGRSKGGRKYSGGTHH